MKFECYHCDKGNIITERKIVCLCGSTKFKKEFEEINKQLTLKGEIVLSVGFFAHKDNDYVSEDQKRALDQLHFDKISISDYIYVIDKNKYIGVSTANEIRYAGQLNKPIKYYSEEVGK